MQSVNDSILKMGLPDHDPMECPDSQKRFP